jgi:hypothetical protein
MLLAGFRCMMQGVILMAASHVSMMSGFLMVSLNVVFRRGAVMLGRVLVMFGSLGMIIGNLFRHSVSSTNPTSPASR